MWLIDIENALRELLDVLPGTVLLTLLLFLPIFWFRRARQKEKTRALLLLSSCFYLSLLLYGTCFSRVESFADFWDFSRWNEGLFVYNVWPTGEFTLYNTSVAHGFFNLLLFVPWGILSVLYVPKLRGVAFSTASALLMSVLIELFQKSHGMGFVVADITFNVFGGLVGSVCCFLVLRFAFWRGVTR